MSTLSELKAAAGPEQPHPMELFRTYVDDLGFSVVSDRAPEITVVNDSPAHNDAGGEVRVVASWKWDEDAKVFRPRREADNHNYGTAGSVATLLPMEAADIVIAAQAWAEKEPGSVHRLKKELRTLEGYRRYWNYWNSL